MPAAVRNALIAKGVPPQQAQAQAYPGKKAPPLPPKKKGGKLRDKIAGY